jgi:hypothetical protein
MKRDLVAPERKVYPLIVWRAESPIPAAPMNGEIGQDLAASPSRVAAGNSLAASVQIKKSN